MRNEQIILNTKVVSGEDVNVVGTTVFAEKKSVKRSEFYAAYQVGLNVKHAFEVDADDYAFASVNGEDPTELIYNGKRYVIVRAYEKDGLVEVVVTE